MRVSGLAVTGPDRKRLTMDDWTYPYPNPDVDSRPPQPVVLDEVWGAVEDRLRVARAEAAAERRAADLEQSRVWDSVDDGRNVLDVPLPFEAPADTSLAY